MMNTLTVLLLCLTAAYAVPVHFPVEKTVVYNYHANVKAGIIEPAKYVSQFTLIGQLHIRKDVSDPTLNNAYYVKLQDVKYGMYNGMVVHDRPIETMHELGEAAQQIQDPFLIVYDENGKLQGVKVLENESGWSRNMKQGIASMLQLDVSHIQMHTPMKPHGFITTENTVQGTCRVAYNVQPKVSVHSSHGVFVTTNPETSNVFVVTKSYDPRNCSHFVQRVFDIVECEKCHVESVDDMTSVAKRVFQVEQQDDNLLIRRMIAYSVINYLPFNARSEAHYLLTNTTLDLDTVMSMAESRLPTVNFQNVPLVRDVTFNKPLGNYALHAAEDLTHGRHIVKLDALIPKLKKMLAEAADYLQEHHMEAVEPEWKHGQTINRLQHTMSYMDLGSLEQVYNAIQNSNIPKEVMMKNIFLRMIPTVGTTAACHFTRNIMRKHKVDDNVVIGMLTKLPMYVKVPSERLLLEMEDLLKLGNTVSTEVQKASILCFSILVRKTFIHQQGEIVNPLLDRYLHRFIDHVRNDQAYEMKIVYLMAMKNIQVGNIEKLLEPIIRGEVVVSEHPHHIRVQAIWAIKKAVADRTEYTHNLLYPILADVTLPLSIRVVAYDVLMSQMPSMQRLMNIYWFMVYEQNEHLYNYHFTTLKGLANSVDPCLTPVREMARKMMRYTIIRPVTTELSSKHFVDYTDPMYEYGESFNTAWVLDELTGLPHAGYIEHRQSIARRPFDRMGIYWSVSGMDEIMKVVKEKMFGNKIENLTNKNVQNILSRAAHDMPTKRMAHADFCMTMNGLVVFVNHYDHNTVKKMPEHLHTMFELQEIIYGMLWEMQVPTDMGLQGVLNTRIPLLLSLEFGNIRSEKNVKLEVNTRVWQHGEYAMSIYNPIVDVWHSIRRAVSQDISLPLQMSFTYNSEAKSLKVTMPRLPMSKYSHTGIRHYVKNLVTITGDEQDLLKNFCAACQHHAVVTTGKKRSHHVATDSKDVGLKYSMSIFDCESKVTPMTIMQEWHRVLSPDHKNTWGSQIVQYIMGMRQKMMTDYISPKMSNCGVLLKSEPSIVHPTLQVDMTVRFNMEDVDNEYEKMHAFSGKRINIHGTLDAKSISMEPSATNQSVRMWDMNANIDVVQGHVANNLKVQITRITPGEKKLKICVDAQKNYPETELQPRIGNSKAETIGKMSITAGYTDDDKCVRDEMLISVSMKGEMTEEQKNQMMHDSVHGACAQDIENPQFYTKDDHLPKTTNCIREIIRYTTMRKYTINASYKKIPVYVSSYFAMLDDHVRAKHLSYVRYIMDRADSGNIRATIEFPADMSHVNATLVTPVNGYEYVEIPLHQDLFEGLIMTAPIPHSGWHTVMDNTHFSTATLNKMTQGMSKICTVYPQTLITLDNGVIPFVVSDQWTLVSGDHIDQTYAIFARSVHGNMIAVRAYVAGHELEIMPGKSETLVSVDGNVVSQHEKGVMVPVDEPKTYAFKLTMNSGHLVIQSQRVPVMMLWTPNSLSLMVDTVLQGHVTGVCGHMDDTHKEKMPKIYTAAL